MLELLGLPMGTPLQGGALVMLILIFGAIIRTRIHGATILTGADLDDGVHPTAAGHDKIADALEAYV